LGISYFAIILPICKTATLCFDAGVEWLGSEVLLDVAVCWAAMVALVDLTSSPSFPEQLRLAVDPERVHFNNTTERDLTDRTASAP
jgi:hypothetical protein